MLGKITLRSVDALRPGQVLDDTELKGFAVRCWSSTAVYSVRGRLNGQRVRITIGRHGTFTPHTARKEATRLLGLLAAGKDPRYSGTKPTTLAEAADAFLAHLSAKRSAGTVREYQGHLRDHLLPRLGRKPLLNITTADLSKLHLDLRDRPVLANRILATASSLYGWADRQGLVPDLLNPSRRVERYPEEGKERFLNIDELKRLGAALRDLESAGRWSPFALSAIPLLLLTGCRRDEIRLLKWTDIDWHRGLINLPRAKRGKRTVHLNTGAMEVLQKLRNLPDDGNPYVIRGVNPREPYKNLQDVWDAVREQAKLSGVRIHDLRHSLASFAGADGASLPLIGAVLGHASVVATKRYLHLTDDPAREVASRVGALIASGLEADDEPN